MLEIKNLYVSVEQKEILRGINLIIKPGEVHAIMGPNGSGKSTLANILAGRAGYEITQGEILFQGKNLLDLSPEQRAHAGLFLGFQYPVEIPGVSNIYFLKAALNAQRKARNLPEVDAMDFLTMVKDKMKLLEMDEDMIYRSLNEGFSGGEKKRNEILQMLVLNPSLALLDETDSGLDIDALRIIALGINGLRNKDHSILLITHYQRLLNYIKPDKVHVLTDGKIVLSGDAQLALELESKGYGWVEE
ncbi:MAG TPA: Fe-S cluster assembly ATPase SufC [Gammaproteobacteria bacterium]|nr:Fe-S cluster assembly ATPase SufC [Gammaproteobacteria bacterium]